MSRNKRTVIIIAIILGSILISLFANLIISLVQKASYPKKYEEFVEKYASEYNVPEYVIYAVIDTESGFDPNARSSAGAFGLMQMIPSTLKFLASDEHLDEDVEFDDLADPETAIRYGTYYLRYLKDKFGDWNTVLAAYNAGEGKVSKWLKDERYSSDGKTLHTIPIAETENYVKKVNNEIGIYRILYEK
jgi:soluble lytic murein transglycosylase